jgi:inosose dehydratase
MIPLTRRYFLQNSAFTAAALASSALSRSVLAQNKPALHIASNQYPWSVFYRRDGKNFEESLDAGLAEVAASGLNGFEPIIGSPDDIDRLAPILKKYNLEIRSLYVNTTLHAKDEAAKSIDHVLAIAAKAKTAGARIIVTNPNPIRWGGPENKDDAMLKTQAAAMNQLGAKLNALGLILSYHNHDIELRNAAREFHHMMVGTDPKFVTLCLDAHWIYRGSGNSTVALFDVLKLYGPRVSELHLRQSRNTVWTEAFGPGDIDYPALAKYLLDINVKPHLVMEQACEAATPKTMSPLQAHQKSSEYARQILAGFTA